MKSRKLFQLAALLVFCCGAFVTEAAAAPKPITRCRTIDISGSYIVTRNLAAAGNCLVIAADNITIDLDGYTISGNGTGDGITDSGVGRKNIAIRNGVVTNFVFGIQFFNSPGCAVERVRASQNSQFGIEVGDKAIVKDNIASGNDIGIFARSGSLVTSNVAFDNTNSGFFISDGSTISNNTAYGNLFGFSVSCPSNIIGNTSVNNSSANYDFSSASCGNNFNIP